MNVRKGAAAVTLALAVTVSGFGSDAAFAGDNHSGDRHSSGRYSSGSHADGTQASSTSRAKISAVVSGAPGQTEPIAVTVDGAIDYANWKGEFTVSQSGAGAAAPSQLIINGANVYTEVPKAALAQTGGKRWIKTDAAEATQSMGFDFDMFGHSENPTDGRKSFEGVGSDITYVGRELISGVRTKHYTALLDFAAIAQRETDPAKKAALTKIAALYGNQPLKTDVWFDKQDRLRKITFSIDLLQVQVPDETQQVTGTIDLTAEFSDFGTAVDVNVPSDNEVTTLADLTAPAAELQPAA